MAATYQPKKAPERSEGEAATYVTPPQSLEQFNVVILFR